MASQKKQRSFQKNKSIVDAIAAELVISKEDTRFITCKVTDGMTSEIPFRVHTFKVIPSRNGTPIGWGPDDSTYAEHPDLLRAIPRAFSRLYIDGKLVYSLEGVTKFDGTTSYDNDEDLPQSQHGLTDHEAIAQWQIEDKLEVRFETKYNGKFAIFTLLMINGRYHIFGGSKNMHTLVDIEKYGEMDDSFEGDGLHFDILRRITSDLKNLKPEELIRMVNNTFVGEYVDGQHLVWVDAPVMAYFINPVKARLPETLELFPRQTTIPTTEQLNEIRRMRDIEGVVILYINKETDQVIRQKHKTIWYTLLRCWREVMANKPDGTTRGDILNLCMRRMHTRSDQFLKLTKEELEWYKALARAFTQWIADSDYKWSDVHFSNGAGMAQVYHDFVLNHDIQRMVVTDLPDEKEPERLDIDYCSYYETGFAGYTFEQLVNAKKRDIYIRNHIIDMLCANKRMAHNVLWLAGVNHKVAVIMQGAPGSGKTALTSVLIESIQMVGPDEEPITCERFCTDDIFERRGGYDASKLKQFHGENFDAFAASTADVKFCENTNCKQWEWSRYAKVARDAGYVVVVITMKENDPKVLSRNVHNVPEKHLVRMCKSIQPAVPMYYGLFPQDKMVASLVEVTQKTALHVTCKFVGGDRKRMLPDGTPLGSSEEIEVIGISTNEAGRALVVECQRETEAAIPHITLSTNDGFTPVQVGQMIDVNDLDTSIAGEKFWGVFSAMF